MTLCRVTSSPHSRTNQEPRVGPGRAVVWPSSIGAQKQPMDHYPGHKPHSCSKEQAARPFGLVERAIRAGAACTDALRESSRRNPQAADPWLCASRKVRHVEDGRGERGADVLGNGEFGHLIAEEAGPASIRRRPAPRWAGCPARARPPPGSFRPSAVAGRHRA